jgi:outer membrane protein assembly factor BamB
MSDTTPQASVLAADSSPAAASNTAPRLRLWPAVLIIIIQWLVITVPAWVVPGTQLQVNCMIYGAVGGGAAIALWWLFASRARWTDRLLVLVFFAASAIAAYPLYHPTFVFRNYGPLVRGVPLATTLWVVWLVLTPSLGWPARRLGALAAIVLAWGYCALLRIDGVDGDFVPAVSWRWSLTPEQKFLAELGAGKAAAAAVPAMSKDKGLTLEPGDWPGFRGANRDSRLEGVRIATDWKENPPRQLWRHRIGPGWSSFAVIGDRLYTQEQRGEEETVVCYQAATGQELWAHADNARFFETIGGAGPRSTPTFQDGFLYTLGAGGILNCLDPATGRAHWSHDILADSGREKLPEWGYSSSPLIVRGIVTVFAGGPRGKSVLGYHASNGRLAWSSGNGTESYSSLHLARTGGVDQVLLSADDGLTSFDPVGGKILWHHDWPLNRMACIAQPALIGENDFLFGNHLEGSRRIHVTKNGETWAEKQVWETKAIKPYYNDLVIYKDHLYGFDGSFFNCVSLKDGKGRWKARGYGSGQVLLLADQGLLLIVSEKGDVALVEAIPDKHKELARFPAIAGKTWNHPVVAHGKLFVRNGEEVACYQLSTEAPKPPIAQ